MSEGKTAAEVTPVGRQLFHFLEASTLRSLSSSPLKGETILKRVKRKIQTGFTKSS